MGEKGCGDGQVVAYSADDSNTKRPVRGKTGECGGIEFSPLGLQGSSRLCFSHELLLTILGCCLQE